MKHRKPLVGFLQAIVEKNYAQSNKYLQEIITEKLKSRIALAVKNTRLF